MRFEENETKLFWEILFSKHVVFGHVLSGKSIVDKIENVPVDAESNRPLKEVMISDCGLIDKIKKRQVSSENESQSASDDEKSKKKDNSR